MKTRFVGALIIGLGWAAGCGGGGKTTEPDAAVIRDSSAGPDTRPAFDTARILDVGDTAAPRAPDAGTPDVKDAALTDAIDAPFVPDAARPLDTLDANEAGNPIGPREAGTTPDSREVGGETNGCAFTDGGSRYPFYCGRGYIGSVCEDVLDPPKCIAGEWSCGTTDVGRPLPRQDQCTCFGLPPGGPNARCECIGHSWKCLTPDGGSSEVAHDAPAF